MLSYWQQTAWFNKTDIAIIGSGIVGLSAAIHIKKRHPRLRVCIFEKGNIPMGATSRNAGFATFGSISEIVDDLTSQSEESVFQLAQKRITGLNKLRNLIGDEGIEYEASGGYEIFRTQQEFYFYENQINEINSKFEKYTGQKEVYSIPEKKPESFGLNTVYGLIFNQYEGLINSGKLTRSLISTAQSTGIELFNGFEVSNYHSEKDNVILTFKDPDLKIAAGKVLFCTNGFSSPLFPKMDVKPARGLILVTGIIEDLKLCGGFHHNKGFDYFRQIDGRVLLGGGRNLDIDGETTTDNGINPKLYDYLYSLLKNTILVNKTFTIDHIWTGTMGIGESKAPIVKEIQPHVFCAVRMGGMGVALGTITGEEAAELILNSFN